VTTAPDGLQQLLARLEPAAGAALTAALQQGRIAPGEVAQAWRACGGSPAELSRWVAARVAGGVSDTIREAPSAQSSGRLATQAAPGGVASRGLGEGPSRPGDPPQRVGPYEVIRELARGGMGVVFVARHAQLGRQVALKVLPRGATPEEGERFQLEAQAAARLKHPNIVGVHEVGVERGQPWLAMDLIEGETLHTRIGRDGPLPEAEAAAILEQVARAVAFAHARGVLHRDIKPHNVLLDREGTPFLADFGLAKELSKKEKGVTIQGQVVGTPAYMPPEQAAGESELVDRRADVYALGATLYHALTGRAPFDGPTAMNIITKVLMREPERPSKLRPRLDRDLETVCLHAMEKDIAARYRTAQAFADDLRRCQDGAPIAARPVGAVGRLWRRVRKNRALSAGAGAVGLLLVIVWAVMTVRLERSRSLERAARVEEERAKEDAEQKGKSAEEAARRAEKAERLALAAGQRLLVRRELDQGTMQLSLARHVEAARTFTEAEAKAAALPDATLVGAARRGAREARRHLGRRVRPASDDDAPGHGCAFAPRGRVLASVEGQELIVRDLARGADVFRARVGPCQGAYLAFTPDGATLVGALNVDGAASLEAAWEVSSGRERWRHERAPRAPTGLAIDPAGRVVAIGDMAGAVTLMDPATGREIGQAVRAEQISGAAGDQSSVYSLAFAPGELGTLLSIGYANGLLADLDLGKSRVVVRNERVAYMALAWAARDAVVPGKLLLVGGDQKGGVVVWEHDPATGEYRELAELLHREEGQVRSLAVRPASGNGEGLIAATTEGGTAWVWDGSFRRRGLIHTGDDDAQSCAFSPDGGALVTAGPWPASVWDPGPRRVPGGAPVAFSAAGDRVVVCRPREPVQKPVVLPDGRHRTVPDRGFQVAVHDLGAGVEQEQELPNEYGVLDLLAMGVGPDGDVLITTRENHEHFDHRRLWRWRPGQPPQVIELERAATSLAVTREGDVLLGQQVDMSPNVRQRAADVELRALPGGAPRARFEWHNLSVIALEPLPDGRCVTASFDGSVAWWEPDPARRPTLLDVRAGRAAPWASPAERAPSDWGRLTERVVAMDCSPEQEVVAVGFGDGRVRLWRFDLSPHDPPVLHGHEQQLVLCAFQPGGETLVTASREGLVRVWDVAMGTVLRTIEPPAPRIEAASLSPDGGRLAVASAGDVWIYSLGGE
jgi:WD40 repeat protein